MAAPIVRADQARRPPQSARDVAAPFQPSWNSLRTIPVPEWLRNGKFGIYTHWGIYSVPAFGQNGTWYAHNVYSRPNSADRKHHEATYGPLEKFGYKDFIPMFTGSRFDSDEWAELFKKAGARFAGPRRRTSRRIRHVEHEILSLECGADGSEARRCGRAVKIDQAARDEVSHGVPSRGALVLLSYMGQEV